MFFQIAQEIMLLPINNMHEKSNSVPKMVIQCKLLYYVLAGSLDPESDKGTSCSQANITVSNQFSLFLISTLKLNMVYRKVQ